MLRLTLPTAAPRLVAPVLGALAALLLPGAAGAAPLSFVNPATFPMPAGTSNAQPLVAGDINGDGALDIVVSNRFQGLSVFLGDGAGGFARPATRTPVGVDAIELVSADLNGDGIADVVTSGPQLGVLLGSPSGLVAAPGTPIELGTPPRWAAIGDVNGDRIPDVVATLPGLNVVAVLRGNGDGTLTSDPGVPVPSPLGVALADADGNGTLDLLVTRLDATVDVLLGDGAGGFTRAEGAPIAIGGQPTAIAAGDVDGDGRPDPVVTSSGPLPPFATLLHNDGGGRFGVRAMTPFANAANYGFALADLDRDGRIDAAAPAGGPGLVLRLGTAGGSLDTPAPVAPLLAGTTVTATAIADVDRDGRPDLLATINNSTLAVLRNVTPDDPPPPPPSSTPPPPAAPRPTARPKPKPRPIACTRKRSKQRITTLSCAKPLLTLRNRRGARAVLRRGKRLAARGTLSVTGRAMRLTGKRVLARGRYTVRLTTVRKPLRGATVTIAVR